MLRVTTFFHRQLAHICLMKYGLKRRYSCGITAASAAAAYSESDCCKILCHTSTPLQYINSFRYRTPGCIQTAVFCASHQPAAFC